jgi:uncharacterized hydrophobic protein (TIGR00271 family)
MSEESKFNFSEEEQQQIEKDKAVEEKKEAVKKDAQGLFASISNFLSELLDFRDDTDREATITAIQGDISFKGATAWILICSIFVASIGLNANSTAVVIGAMLISPLMGPILGVGMSIAINDIFTLRKSLINLATMIVLSLLTAFLFFKFFPTADVGNSEIFGRTKPDFRDVLIAFFGGLALIIARTKKGTIASVIFGVAIATALMPPLCVAGYGLANDWSAFYGAMYLFIINSIFIALATFLVLKLLRFPMLKYANSKKRKRIARLATVIAIIVMIPAGITFWDVYKESEFNTAAENFRDKELSELPHADYIKRNFVYKYNSDRGPYLEINSFGLDEIPESTIELLKNRIDEYPSLVNSNTKLFYDPISNSDVDSFKYMQELRVRDSLDLLSQAQKISYLESRLKVLSKLERYQIPFESIVEEAKINYDNLEAISYANEISFDFSNIDTLTVFKFRWIDSLSTPETIARDSKKLEKWLKVKLKLDTLVVQ